MKKRFFLFGVPTLFTVFVILMVLSFASLAYLNVSQETKAMARGTWCSQRVIRSCMRVR